MNNKKSVRAINKEKFIECIELRKQGLSYSQIQKTIIIPKSTLSCWFKLSGLTLTKEQLKIREEIWHKNHIVATQAAKVIRLKISSAIIDNTIERLKQHFSDPLFVVGVMLYEAEGAKGCCRFSNSDFKLIKLFILFAQKYLEIDRKKNLKFCLYLHLSRSSDLTRIKNFWAEKLHINEASIKVYWKKHIIRNRRENEDYVGQMDISVVGGILLTRKLRQFSDIILAEQFKYH